jgi:hypothetical protein
MQLSHEFDNFSSSFLQSKCSCSLHMYFLWRHRSPPDKSGNDPQDNGSLTLIDSHIVLTYDCWQCFLVFNISGSRALEMQINFYYPTLELLCFSFTQPFTKRNWTDNEFRRFFIIKCQYEWILYLQCTVTDICVWKMSLFLSFSLIF